MKGIDDVFGGVSCGGAGVCVRVMMIWIMNGDLILRCFIVMVWCVGLPAGWDGGAIGVGLVVYWYREFG